MATRLNYTPGIWRHLVADTATRLRGGLPSRVASGGDPLVIVTGPGRSGTSAVARVFHESGVKLGRTFANANEMNPVGFYEDAPVRDLNDRIIFECGLQRMERWPWRSTLLAIADRYANELQELANDALGGWKDPQFTTTLEAWLPHLLRRPKIVVCLRSPNAYVESVINASGMHSPELLRKRWAQQYERLLAVIRDYELDATCIEYEELVRDPETTIAALSAFADHQLDAGYIDASLRQFRHPVLPPYAELYRRVYALSGRSLPDDEAMDADEYLRHVADIEQRVAEAKAQWTATAGMPAPPFARGESLSETRDACGAFESTLRDAHNELGSLAPPAALAQYHELTSRAVDVERAITNLVRQTCQDGGAPDADEVRKAIDAWRQYTSPEAIAKADQERMRARERGLKEAS